MDKILGGVMTFRAEKGKVYFVRIQKRHEVVRRFLFRVRNDRVINTNKVPEMEMEMDGFVVEMCAMSRVVTMLIMPKPPLGEAVEISSLRTKKVLPIGAKPPKKRSRG